MDTIKITNNHEEMKAIAREIMAEKKDYYSDQLLGIIRNLFSGRLPDATNEEIEDLVLLSIYSYWVYGSTTEEFFNYDFANKTHEEKLEYITLRLRLKYIEHLSRKEDAHLLFNKYETYQLFTKEYDRDVILCSTEADYPVFRDFIEKHKEFVVKPTDMSGARGVHKADVIGLDEDGCKKFYLDMLGETELAHEQFRQGEEHSVVVEEIIEQDDELAAFHPASVNGVRVPTIKVDGKVTVYQPWFKVGRGGHFITSSIFGTLMAGIDSETGVIDTLAYPEYGEGYEYHPDSGLRMLGYKIPKWDELVEMATQCALKLPTIGYVGWDFVLSKRGWVIMEGNYSGNFMWQVCRRRGMRKEFEELIGWKFDKEFWWK